HRDHGRGHPGLVHLFERGLGRPVRVGGGGQDGRALEEPLQIRGDIPRWINVVVRVDDPRSGARLRPSGAPGEQHAGSDGGQESENVTARPPALTGMSMDLIHDRAAARATSTRVATRSGVIGSSSIVTPSGASASSTALASAAGAIMRPPSPPPFTPYSVNGDGASPLPISMRGASCAVGSR